MIKSINKKHQAIVNRFVKWSLKYDAIVNETGDSGSTKQQNAWDKAAELWVELPKREQANLARQLPNVKGCY